MKANRRWWNDGRHDRDCAYEDALHGHLLGEPLMAWYRRDTIRAITEAGLEIRVKLITRFPMHCGVAYL